MFHTLTNCLLRFLKLSFSTVLQLRKRMCSGGVMFGDDTDPFVKKLSGTKSSVSHKNIVCCSSHWVSFFHLLFSFQKTPTELLKLTATIV